MGVSNPDAGTPGGCFVFETFTTIDQPTTLTRDCSPYAVPQGGAFIDAELTIEPGVVINFAEEGLFTIGFGGPGRIVALGTAADPIIFAGMANQSENRWDGLKFFGSAQTSRLGNVIFRRCGNRDAMGAPSGDACVNLDNDAPDNAIELNDVTFEDAAVGIRVKDTILNSPSGLIFDAQTQVGLWMFARTVGSIQDSYTYNGNINRIDAANSNNFIEADATWVEQDAPWVSDGDIRLRAPSGWMPGDPVPELTLEAGIQIQLAPEKQIEVAVGEPAALRINGTAQKPVQISSMTPGSPSENTRGIQIRAQTTSFIARYLQISDGGFEAAVNSTAGACIRIEQLEESAVVEIENSTFADCRLTGVSTLDADLFRFSVFDNNTFNNTIAGVVVRPDTAGSIGPNQTYMGTTVRNEIKPGPLTRDALWLRQDVPWQVGNTDRRSGLEVDAVLTIQEGATLQFEDEVLVSVAENSPGQLIAEGFNAMPIVFTNVGTRWNGIVFYPGSDGSRLNFTTIEGAGLTSGNIVQGCVTARGAAANITVTQSLFIDCNLAGIGTSDSGQHFANTDGNTFQDMEVGLRLHVDSVGAFGPQMFQNVTRNELIGGVVATDASWVSQGLPWGFADSQSIVVDANLSIQGGNEIRFPSVSGQGLGISVGFNTASSLQLNGTMGTPVVLTSAETGPMPGNWNNISFGGFTQNSSLSFFEISYAGRGGRAAIDLNGNAMLVTITSPTFTNNMGPDIDPN